MPDRTSAPAIKSIEQVSIPEAVSVNLDNGIPLHFINAGTQPVMRLEVIFKAGKWFEHEPGHSYFAGKMLVEGTEQHSASEIATFFDELGAFVEISCGYDRVTLSIHLLQKHLDTILPILREMIYNPAFKLSEFTSLKERKRQQLAVDLQKNNFLASRSFTKAIFGGNHPYGRSLTLQNIDETPLDKVSEFFQDYIRGNFEIILSGMVNDKHVQSINDALGSNIRSSAALSDEISGTYNASEQHIDKKDSLQSAIRLGMPFIGRQHPEFIETLVVNEILGGYFGSRLMRNIREEKGYTYGIRSVMGILDHASFWTVSTEVKAEFRDRTITEIKKEIGQLQSELVPDSELTTVKNYILGTFVSSLDTPFALADKFKSIHFSGLNYHYYQDFFHRVGNITSERVLELSRKYLCVENMSLVTVG